MIISLPIGAMIELYPRILFSGEFAGIIPICIFIGLFLLVSAYKGNNKKEKGRVFLYSGVIILIYTMLFLFWLSTKRAGWPEGESRDLYDAYVRFVSIFASAFGASSIMRSAAYFADADVENKKC
jgi:apolipoprotein N-acyltransferase